MTDVYLSDIAAGTLCARGTPTGIVASDTDYSGISAGTNITANYDHGFSSGYRGTGLYADFTDWDGIHDNFFTYLKRELFDLVPEDIAETDIETADGTISTGDYIAKGFIEKNAAKSIFIKFNFGGYFRETEEPAEIKGRIETLFSLPADTLTAGEHEIFLATLINGTEYDFKDLYLWIYRPYGDKHGVFAMKLLIGIYHTDDAGEIVSDDYDTIFENNTAGTYSQASNAVIRNYVFDTNTGSLLVPSFASATWTDPNPPAPVQPTRTRAQNPRGIFANMNPSADYRSRGIYHNGSGA